MISKINKLQKTKGFTLVELIVVIAIIAILTAVIVPLVGRYSAQAVYTSLQDTAKSISNSTSYAITDVTKAGTISRSTYFTGTKTNGILTVTSDVSGDDTEDKICESLKELLQSAVDEGANFRAVVSSNAVVSVIYSKDQDVTGVADNTGITKDSDFSNGYLYNNKAVGVFGNYMVNS